MLPFGSQGPSPAPCEGQLQWVPPQDGHTSTLHTRVRNIPHGECYMKILGSACLRDYVVKETQVGMCHLCFWRWCIHEGLLLGCVFPKQKSEFHCIVPGLHYLLELVLYALGLQTLVWVGSCGDDTWFFFCTRDSGWIGSECCLCEDGLVMDMGGNRSGVPCP